MIIKNNNWPASGGKGPSDITNSIDKDRPHYDVEYTYTPIHNKIVYIARKISAIDVMIVKKCVWSGSTLFAHVRRSLFA